MLFSAITTLIYNYIVICADFFGNLSKIIKQFPFNVNLLKCDFLLPVFFNRSWVQWFRNSEFI